MIALSISAQTNTRMVISSGLQLSSQRQRIPDRSVHCGRAFPNNHSSMAQNCVGVLLRNANANQNRACLNRFPHSCVNGTQGRAITLICGRPQRGGLQFEEFMMKKTILQASLVVAVVAYPLMAHAEGTVRGAQEGAEAGGRASGPPCALVRGPGGGGPRD